MSHVNSVMKTVLTLLLSTMMALPTTSTAQTYAGSDNRSATDGVPVTFMPVMTAQGRIGYLYAASIPASQEEELAVNLAKSQAEGSFILQVSGTDDKVAQAVAKAGFLHRTRVFITKTLDESPLFKFGGLDKRTKVKIRQKIRLIDKAAKSDEANALLYGLFYSGIQGGFSWMASSALSSGIAVLSGLMAWNSFVLTQPDFWSKVLNSGGAAALKLAGGIASLLGTELSDRDKRIWDTVGKFTLSLSVNAVQAAYVKFWNGDFSNVMPGWQGVLQIVADSGWAGTLNNYNIWDAVMMQKAAEGKIKLKTVHTYFKGQMVVGAVMESLAYKGVSWVSLIMVGLTVSGMLYLMLSPDRQEAVMKTGLKMTIPFRYGVAVIKNPARTRRSIANQLAYSQDYVTQKITYGKKRLVGTLEHCADYLSPSPTPLNHRQMAYEDMQ